MTDLPNVPDEMQQFRENLEEITSDLANMLNDQAVGLNKVADPITLEKEPLIIDFIKQSKRKLKLADDRRKELKAVHDQRGQAVQDRFKVMTSQLLRALNDVTARHGEFRQAEEEKERKRREEAERQAREAERKAREEAEAKQRAAEEEARKARSDEERRQAAANLQRAAEAEAEAEQKEADAQEAAKAVSAPTTARGDLGATASVTGRWDFRNLDMRNIDLQALRPHLKREHVEQAVRAWIKAQGELIEAGTDQLQGVEIYRNRQTRYR